VVGLLTEGEVTRYALPAPGAINAPGGSSSSLL